MEENSKNKFLKALDSVGPTPPTLFAKEGLADNSEITELSYAWFQQAKRATQLPQKKQVSLRIDEDILDFFKQQGSRYQTKIHAVLRAYVDGSKAPIKKLANDLAESTVQTSAAKEV